MEEARDIVNSINLDALIALCDRYDKLHGAFPEHQYEGKAVFEFFEKLRKGVEQKKKVKLLVSHWDEWFAPIYACPFCAETKLLDDFNFCPACGRSLNDFVFEREEEVCKRITKKEK